MSRRRHPKTCEWCGRDWEASKPSCRTCSPKCRAQLRETEKPTKGSGPREYPAEIIELVTSLYLGGMTVHEVAKVAPNVPGVSRNDQLKAAGNGVVPAQAAAALRDMLNHQEATA